MAVIGVCKDRAPATSSDLDECHVLLYPGVEE
jgi:hypothetical protein